MHALNTPLCAQTWVLHSTLDSFAAESMSILMPFVFACSPPCPYFTLQYFALNSMLDWCLILF